MNLNENFLMDISILYRNIIKYFDHVLAKYDIRSGQILFLTFINENEGCTMQDVTRVSEVDKGTTTKSINRLIEQGYVQSRQDEKDRRSKHLYTTEKAHEVMHAIYQYRNECRKILSNDIDFDLFSEMMSTVTNNSRQQLNLSEDLSDLKIGGLVKMSLVDYPDKVCATIFTSGCSFKCPYCHNRDLVYIPENYSFVNVEEIFSYLEKRKNLLDGVCISGGEPLMQEKLIPFLKEIKNIGYDIKLDYTGNFLNRLKEIVELDLVDYIAMDIKNTKEKYAMTIGNESEHFSVDMIDESMQYIKQCGIPYEFRTTIVKELHTKDDILNIAKWIGTCEAWYLQQFNDSDNCIHAGFHAYETEEMNDIFVEAKKIMPNVKLRGVSHV